MIFNINKAIFYSNNFFYIYFIGKIGAIQPICCFFYGIIKIYRYVVIIFIGIIYNILPIICLLHFKNNLIFLIKIFRHASRLSVCMKLFHDISQSILIHLLCFSFFAHTCSVKGVCVFYQTFITVQDIEGSGKVPAQAVTGDTDLFAITN